MPLLSPIFLLRPPELVDSKAGRHRGPLPGARVLPRGVSRATNTYEKAPSLYPMPVCRLASSLRPPEYPDLQSIRRYRRPLPGVRVLSWVFRSLLTSRQKPHVFTCSICSVWCWKQLGTVVPEIARSSYGRHFDLAAILFWMGW